VKEIIDFLFREYDPIVSTLQGNQILIVADTVGASLMSIGSFLFGAACLIFSGRHPQDFIAPKKRANIAKLVGLSCIFFGITLAFAILCRWHNYGNLLAILRVISGLFILFTLLYVPIVLIAIRKTSLEEVKEALEQTKEKIEQFKKITITSIEN
jgi:Ca2+/H+ antiporter